MPQLNTLAASKTRRVLVFGPPKSGKTEVVGRLAENMNLIWFDLENGKDTLFKLPAEQQAKIQLISIPDSRSFPMAIETCLKVIKGGPCDICVDHGKVKCQICLTKKSKGDTSVQFDDVELGKLSGRTDIAVVFDSLTQLTNSAIANITKGKPDDYKLDYDDWGNLGKLMDIFLSHVQAARFNVVCISHETEVDMVDGKAKIVPTAGTRNFSRNTAKYFDSVVYAEVKNKEHRLGSSTIYANNILTGSRNGVSLDAIKEPKLWDLFKE